MANRRKRTGCFDSITNFITAILMLAACGAIFYFGYFLFGTDSTAETPAFISQLVERFSGEQAPRPTAVSAVIRPTVTDTPIPSLIQPTFTPVTPLPSATPRPSNTPRPDESPTPRPTLPSRTPTPTPTNTPTNTPTPTPTGPTPTTAPTRSAFPFTKTDTSPFYLKNFSNSAGCDWLGVAGEVLNLEKNPVSIGSYRIHVWGEGIDQRALAGSAPLYSDSGWEVFLFDAPVVREYNVQLESQNGTAVSKFTASKPAPAATTTYSASILYKTINRESHGDESPCKWENAPLGCWLCAVKQGLSDIHHEAGHTNHFSLFTFCFLLFTIHFHFNKPHD